MRRLIPLLAAVLVVAMAAPAGATPPSGVTFSEETIFEEGTSPPEGGGPFTATGDAVTEGVICDTGEQEDVSAVAVGFQNNKRVNLQVVKEFTCDDGSGSFMMKLQIKIVFPSEKNPAGSNTFNWVITGGTGAYEDLHGTGKGTGIDIFEGSPPPIGVSNTYTGKLHSD